MQEDPNEYPGSASVLEIVVHGGPVFQAVYLLQICLIISFLWKRMANIARMDFDRCDVLIGVVWLCLPMLYAAMVLPSSIMAHLGGGIDSSWSLWLGLDEISILSLVTIGGVWLALILSLMQLIWSQFKSKLLQTSASTQPPVAKAPSAGDA